ncbi:glutamate-cysteine ligase regulatory subunit [Tolypocladium capitatum]|uniref:GCS light chain n=1 Tax=Tolypocladium capitatum TaxID=45235 RepID=A0A2K3QL18_9HYPO|nr:glutamate-cysteine ligase regulatory subunit [Tolypocladium capitatum]
MTKLVLSTGNVMSAGPSIIRKSGSATRSNLELINSLRDNFAAARRDYAVHTPRVNGNGNNNGNSNGSNSRSVTPPQTPVDVWTERDGKALYIPRINWHAAGLRDESNQYEITVKLFLLPGTPVAEHERYVCEALALVGKELGIQTIDLLVVSFPGMSFEGNCEWEADKINAQQGNLEEELATWKVFEELHRQGIAKRLGVSEFGSGKLGAFIKRTTVPPVVDQINLRDCCNVPPPLKQLAEEEGVELNVHVDCTDILPRGTLRELLSHGPQGAGVLVDPAHNGAGLEGEIVPQWVARYMAFVRDRGVIENKGYFAGAALAEA